MSIQNHHSLPKQRIMEVATDLFYAEGIRAVGIDKIIAKAAVAKASFYKHFNSKDALVVAYLNYRDQVWRDWLASEVEKLSPHPENRPLAIFDALANRFSLKDFRGCAFGNTVAELADSDHMGHKVAESHKQKVISYMSRILHEAGYEDTENIAKKFMLLIDGATVTAIRDRSNIPAYHAKQIAALILENTKKKG